jgi:hypothetical protein
MKSSFYSIGIACLCAIAMSCTEQVGTAEELQQYASDPHNHLFQTQEQNSYTVSVAYRPSDLVIAQLLPESYNKQFVDSLDSVVSNYDYFILSLSRGGKEIVSPSAGFDRYGDLLNTLSFRMEQYTSLTLADGDSATLVDVMFDRTYGIGASSNVLFVYERKKSTRNNWVQFNLTDFGIGTGDLRFRFDTEDLDNIPRLKFLATAK